MQFLVGILVFCMVLFIYLHVNYHLKTSDDLEVFEVEQPSKEKLEEVCDLRQPVRFDFDSTNLVSVCQRESINDSYGAFDAKVRDLQLPVGAEEELYVPMPFANAVQVMGDDQNSRYVLESSADFLDETGLAKEYRVADEFIRPPMVSSCTYELAMGSDGACTPFRYDLNYRNYYLVTEGEVAFKLAPPRSTKHLHEIKDYENFEFRSPVDPWKVQANYRNDFDKIKCLEITLKKGQILHLPAYWWYSIKHTGSSTLCSFKYKTYMNTVAILPKLFMRFLQTQNVKRHTASVMGSEGSVLASTSTTSESRESEQ